MARAEGRLRSSGVPGSTADILALIRAQGAAPHQTVSEGGSLLPAPKSSEMNRLKTLKIWQTSTKDGKSGWDLFEAFAAQYVYWKSRHDRMLIGKFFYPAHNYLSLDAIMKKAGTTDREGAESILSGLSETGILQDYPSTKGTVYYGTMEGKRIAPQGNPFLKDQVTPEDWIGLIQLEIEPWEKLLERQKEAFKAVEDAMVTSQKNIESLKNQSKHANDQAQTAFSDLKALKASENPDPVAVRKKEASVSDATRLAERLQKQLEIEIRADEMQRLDFETGKAKFFAKCREIEQEIDRLHEAQMVIRSTRVSTMIKKLNGTEGTGSTESLSEKVTRILASVQAKHDSLKGDGNASGASADTVADANSIVNTLDLEQRLAALNEKQGVASPAGAGAESLKADAGPLADALVDKGTQKKTSGQ